MFSINVIVHTTFDIVWLNISYSTWWPVVHDRVFLQSTNHTHHNLYTSKTSGRLLWTSTKSRRTIFLFHAKYIFFLSMGIDSLIHLKVHLTLSICTLIISIRRQFTSNKNNVDLQYIYCFVLRVPRWKVALISIIVFRKDINWRYECWWAIKRYLWYDSRLGEGIL